MTLTLANASCVTDVILLFLHDKSPLKKTHEVNIVSGFLLVTPFAGQVVMSVEQNSQESLEE